MKRQTIVEQIQHESEVLKGEATRDMTYESHHTFPTESAAIAAFDNSVARLLNVNQWSSLSSLSADFALYDSIGKSKPNGPVEVGDFIQIDLPGPTPQNWVQVIHRHTSDKMAEFTVKPCHDPLADKPAQIEHFFAEQARSTFRVERVDCTLSAFEIGQQEAINNQEPQAGGRGLINTITAEAGWLFYQKIQWKLLTDYLVQV